MKTPTFEGCATALVSPFYPDGTLDLPSYRGLVSRQLNAGIDALVVCATTGESPVLSHDERTLLIENTVEMASGKIPIIVGTGSNSTETAIKLSKEAQELGADAILVVTPFYNKATQTGLVRHYQSIADAVSIPLILYNVPSRTGVSCSAETYQALSAHPNIVGVKEASGNFPLIQKIRNLCPDFFIWSGNDEDTTAICALGGKGVISVASNILPEEICELTHSCLNDQFRHAGEMQLNLFPLIEALFCEINPIPVKYALSALGLCGETLRMPLGAMESDNREKLLRAMRVWKLLPQ